MTQSTFFQANGLSRTGPFSFFQNTQKAGRGLLFTLIFGCAASLLPAQTTWNGSVSTDWNLAANWSAGIPDAADVVIIPNSEVEPIILGGTAAVGKSVILQTDASLTVNATGSLTINGAASIGLLSQGTVTNNGTIVIGNSVAVGQLGIKNDGPSAQFQNHAGGIISLDRSTSAGILNSSGASFTNAGKITIGAVASVGSNGIQNDATSTFDNTACAALIRVVSNSIVLNTGTFTNSGGLIENASGNSSISTNTGVVQNLNGGNFNIGSGNAAVFGAGDVWTGCTSTDWAEATNWLDGSVSTATDEAVIPDVTNDPIILGGTAALAQSVTVLSSASLTVNATGSLTINGATVQGLLNRGAVTNDGNITIGNLASGGQTGIVNEGTVIFQNNAGGEISIDRSTDNGLGNFAGGTFINFGKITVGALAGVGVVGIGNGSASSVFQNNAGGEISIDRSSQIGLLNDSGTFTNAGKITIGAVASVGETGIVNVFNSAVFQNNAGGDIRIDRTSIAGLRNANAFTNAGKITIGALAGVGGFGLLNEFGLGVFQNNAGGEIHIDQTTDDGLHNRTFGTFSNSGLLTIGANGSIGGDGIENSTIFNNLTCAALIRIVSNSIVLNTGTFTNSGGIIENASGNSSISTNTGVVQNLNGGTFAIGSGNAAITTEAAIWTGCTSTDWAEATNWLDGSVPTATDRVNIPNQANDPIIVAGTAAVAKSVRLESGSSLVVSAASSLDISGAGAVGILNLGTVENNGTLRIDATGNDGILNDAIFINKGTLAIGASASIGGNGISNSGGTFTNESGSISIDRTVFEGIFNPLGTFTNKATLQIGGVASLNGSGIFISPGGTFLNESGSLSIDRTATNGIQNLGAFTNKATLTIGAVAGSIGSDGIGNTGTFLNDICGQFFLFDNLNNSATFTNAGLFRVNSAQAHTNSALTNNGIIEYPQGNPIPNVTNNDFIVAPKTIDCAGGTNMLQKGGALSFTAAANWFTDQNLTNPAGTYNQAANTFAPSGLPAGPQTLFFSISDNANGCPRTVSILVDNNADVTPPTITCPANIVKNTDPNQCSAVATYTVTATGPTSCGNVTLSLVSGLVSGSAFPKGGTTVTWKATSGAGATAICAFTVTVADNQAPSITCPSNLVRNTDPNLCSASVTYATPTVSDNCALAANQPVWLSGGTTPTTNGANSTSTFDKGTTTVEWKASDTAIPANTKTCAFTVTVNDTQKPTIACPANKTQGTDPGECEADVTYVTPTGADNCGLPTGQPVWISGGTSPTPSGSNSISTFQKGVTTVTWKATDEAGNTKTCTFKITVSDLEKPLMTCLPDISANNDAGLCSAVVTYTLPTFMDNCPPTSGQSVKISGPASGSAFSVGMTNVVYRATDASGNTKQCTLKVIVTDNQPPTITCPGPIVATGSGTPCKGVAVYSTPTASDNCSGSLTPFLLSGLASGSQFPAGVTTNTWRAIAGNGQSADCSFTVTVDCPNGMMNGGVMNDRVWNGGMMNDEWRGAGQPFQGSETWNVSEQEVLTIPKKLGLSNPDLRLVPNPATTQVEIWTENLGEKGGELTVFDAQGRVVWRQTGIVASPSRLLTLSLLDFAAGMYFVTLRSEGQTVTKRLTVQRL